MSSGFEWATAATSESWVGLEISGDEFGTRSRFVDIGHRFRDGSQLTVFGGNSVYSYLMPDSSTGYIKHPLQEVVVSTDDRRFFSTSLRLGSGGSLQDMQRHTVGGGLSWSGHNWQFSWRPSLNGYRVDSVIQLISVVNFYGYSSRLGYRYFSESGWRAGIQWENSRYSVNLKALAIYPRLQFLFSPTGNMSLVDLTSSTTSLSLGRAGRVLALDVMLFSARSVVTGGRIMGSQVNLQWFISSHWTMTLGITRQVDEQTGFGTSSGLTALEYNW